MFEYAVRVLQKQIDFYSWCLREKVRSTRGMVKDIKELNQAIKILQKEGK